MDNINSTRELAKYINRYYKNKNYTINIVKEERPFKNTITKKLIFYKSVIINNSIIYNIHNTFIINNELFQELSEKLTFGQWILKDSHTKLPSFIKYYSPFLFINDFLNVITSRKDIIDEFLEMKKA